jgi:hypothetical protein
MFLGNKCSTENPQQAKRSELFNFVETELLAIEPDMKEPRTNTYGRVEGQLHGYCCHACT